MIPALKAIATTLRRDSLMMTTAAGSGHPTSCLSCADILAVLYFSEMRYDPKKPNDAHDEFVLSKGHAAPVYYSALIHSGCMNADVFKLRQQGSALEGHPMPRTSSWIRVASGSLGQGLSVGVGIALGQRMRKSNARTYVLMGDGECAEGSVYEALQLGSHYHVSNLCAIIDVNRLGQSTATMLGHDLTAYERRFLSFGWHVVKCNGHSHESLVNAFAEARKHTNKPTVILCKTIKGKGVSFLENKEGWHGKSLTSEQLTKALKQLPEVRIPELQRTRYALKRKPLPAKTISIHSSYTPEQHIATREAYGAALKKLAMRDMRIIALDGETSNSTYSEEVRKARPKQYVEGFIAEQNMIGMAIGLSTQGFIPCASAFAAFFTRAHDQLRMGALAQTHIVLAGSHAGVSIGEDGPSQMGLEDISMFRALPESVVLYPCDAVSTERCVQLAAQQKRIVYMRTTRPKTPVLYPANERFTLNDFKILRSSGKDSIVIVAAGITVHEALKAYEHLRKKRMYAAVVDCYCLKPFPAQKFKAFAKQKRRVLVVEDHYAEGGLGEMIASALSGETLSFAHLAVRKIPRAGTSQQLLHASNIDAGAIITTVMRMMKR